MRVKPLISTAGAIGILAISVAAFANAWSGSLAKGEVQTMEMVPPMETTTPMEKTLPMETAAIPTIIESSPEPAADAYQSKIGSMDWDGEDVYLLAKIAMAEAEDQDTAGKALVILVVLNRVRDKGFPDTIHDVIYEERQFSPVADGRFDSVEPDEDCWRALDMVQDGHWDESQGALYFESKSESTWHEQNLQFLFKHGNHYFYREKE